MKNHIYELYALDRLSAGNTVIHQLHPRAKLIATLVFIVTVVSFGRGDFKCLVPYIFYPAILMALSEIPYSMLLKRFLIALPFCIFAGISNVIFDRAAAFTIGGVTISVGLVSFFAILFRAYLCVMAVLILVSVTPLAEISKEMRRLRIPNIFVTTLEITYRYIELLMNNAHSMYIAYSLRGISKKGVEIWDMGSFVGQLLLRSFDGAERVYNAMKCRGYFLTEYDYHSRLKNEKAFTKNDFVFLVMVCCFCLLFRFWDINTLFTAILERFT